MNEYKPRFVIEIHGREIPLHDRVKIIDKETNQGFDYPIGAFMDLVRKEIERLEKEGKTFRLPIWEG